MKKLLFLMAVMGLMGSQMVTASQQEDQSQGMQETVVETPPGWSVSINFIPDPVQPTPPLTSAAFLKKYMGTIALPLIIGAAAGVLCKKIDAMVDFNPILLLLATWPLTASLRIALVNELLNDISNGEVVYNKTLAQTINTFAACIAWLIA